MKEPLLFRSHSEFTNLLPVYTMSKEELFQELETHQSRDRKAADKKDPVELIHEIEVHQLELEIQNRELLESHKLLQESFQKYQDIYDLAPVSYFTLDTRGNILQLNCTSAEFFSVEKKKLIGKSFNRYVTKDSRPCYADFLSRCQRALPRQKVECELLLELGKNEALRYIHLTATRTTDHKEDSFLVVLIDRTQEKKIELLESQTTSLRTEIGLREKFVNSLSHDLRTPLTSSKLCSQMLSSMLSPDLENDKARKIFNLLVEELERADRMIKELLDANKIENELSLPLNKIKICLDLQARHCLEKFTQVYQEKLKLNFDVRGNVTGNWAPHSIDRILENLLTNAIKYGDTNKPITVLVEDLKENVGLTVHNFGNAINPHDQKKIFEAFHQTLNSKIGALGWGLGLDLVNTLVKQHKGEIRLKSTNSDGTFFQVILPRV